MCDEITNCQVENSFDKKLMRILAKWNSKNVEFVVLQSKSSPLRAMVTCDELVKHACETFGENKESYLEKLKIELQKPLENYEYTLKNNQLSWNIKGRWRRTSLIKLQVVDDIIKLSDFMENIMDYSAKENHQIKKLVNENDVLKNKLQDMSEILKKLIDNKETFENELYNKFIMLLDTKKQRIKTLENELLKFDKNINKIYNENTDASDIDNDNDNDVVDNTDDADDDDEINNYVKRLDENKQLAKKIKLDTTTTTTTTNDDDKGSFEKPKSLCAALMDNIANYDTQEFFKDEELSEDDNICLKMIIF
ncbi:hypothetical protein HCN44_008893 [Aphidius gifuensis]|uniref:XRCC4 coiled-coil domain-containing protein n=1 Tax=Aphidius gifuensis TaxID=684658 RepID=A0A834XTV9_APHGI|nr:hypothetical protein HCN44_008893 [Aphidius gifuensis]